MPSHQNAGESTGHAQPKVSLFSFAALTASAALLFIVLFRRNSNRSSTITKIHQRVIRVE